MLPVSLIRSAENRPVLVELKSGETYNGHLVNCDNWMNINLRQVVCTSKDADRFWKIPHIYIRGNTIKYLNIEEEVLSLVKEKAQETKQQLEKAGRGRGRGRGVQLNERRDGGDRDREGGGRGRGTGGGRGGGGGGRGGGRGGGGGGGGRGGHNNRGGRGGRGGR